MTRQVKAKPHGITAPMLQVLENINANRALKHGFVVLPADFDTILPILKKRKLVRISPSGAASITDQGLALI
jgi:hypothetical protein